MLDSRLIDEIQKLTNEIKIENKIENKEIIRDDVFNMSSDKGAKFFVENKLNTAKNKISVVDIEETFTKLITPSSNSIKWKDVRSIISIWENSNPTDEKKYKHIRQCWDKDVTEDKE